MPKSRLTSLTTPLNDTDNGLSDQMKLPHHTCNALILQSNDCRQLGKDLTEGELLSQFMDGLNCNSKVYESRIEAIHSEINMAKLNPMFITLKHVQSQLRSIDKREALRHQIKASKDTVLGIIMPCQPPPKLHTKTKCNKLLHQRMSHADTSPATRKGTPWRNVTRRNVMSKTKKEATTIQTPTNEANHSPKHMSHATNVVAKVTTPMNVLKRRPIKPLLMPKSPDLKLQWNCMVISRR